MKPAITVHLHKVQFGLVPARKRVLEEADAAVLPVQARKKVAKKENESRRSIYAF